MTLKKKKNEYLDTVIDKLKEADGEIERKLKASLINEKVSSMESTSGLNSEIKREDERRKLQSTLQGKTKGKSQEVESLKKDLAKSDAELKAHKMPREHALPTRARAACRPARSAGSAPSASSRALRARPRGCAR